MFNNHIFQNKTILVVDDDALNRATVIDTLLQKIPSLTTLSANHGAQALKILEKKTVDVILLDWDMPVMNGLETLKAFQKNKDWAAIPTLMYTGIMTSTENLTTALEYGAVDFLRKPVDSTELLARLKTVLRQKEMEKERLKLLEENNHIRQLFWEKENEMLKKQLQSHLLLLAQKNEVLLDIKQKCDKNIMKEQEIKALSREIEMQIEQNDYWSGFMDKVNQIDHNFIQELIILYPDLSNSEIRFCALLRCQLDNKSIANLLNITMSGVEKLRYRIRKKMNLSTQDNLEKVISVIS